MSGVRRPALWGAAGAAMWLAAGLAAGCAHRPAPAALVPVANPAAPVVTPRGASGTYDLLTTLAVSRRAPPPPPRRGQRPPSATLRLDYQSLAAPDATATSTTQLAAAVSIPGYTRAPSGRLAQAAAWWPLPGDSVVVHFQASRGDGVMELRGTLVADTLAGEIWFTSTASGSTYQMGTFKAVKRKR